MQTDTITVKNVNLTEKNGKQGPYTRMVINSEEGGMYSGFVNKDTEVPNSGDMINIAFEENGQYRNIKKLEILMSSNEKPDTKTASSTPTKAKQTTTNTVSKDTSMEVSGMFQALIIKHGFNENSEKLLREALDIKRRVAKDYE